ncbi:probable G-protein coupled receptor 139 [Heptranchias perlo]|uniref:probable G-protein coupled receptor 139 n=1 Tax=Heptranchias perlo TaxID=212740 RepID=UPI00355A45EF
MGSRVLDELKFMKSARREASQETFGIIKFGANLMTIVILSRGKCGLSKCITRYLVAMAAADLFFIIFDVILNVINNIHFPNSFLNYTPVCSLILILSFASIDCSVWLTVAFTFDRFVAICCQKLRVKYCTEKTAAVVIATVCVLNCLEDIPSYFTFAPQELIDNESWFCTVKSSFYTSPVWVAIHWFDIILTPFAPFVLILLFNALTIRHILMTSRIRRGLRAKNNSENHKDPEMESRRKSIILLLSISGSFILLWFITLTYFICVQIIDFQLMLADYSDPLIIMEQTGYMLQSLSSCTNTFIYAVAQNKFRGELKNVIKYPFHQIINSVKRFK